MATARANDVGRHLRQLFGPGSGVGLTDSQLLERFASAARRGEHAAEDAEAAFETILARHGPTVLAVCRQVLGDGHAAEDAFQATFLVLVRRATSLRMLEHSSLGAWLHGVAYRTALKAQEHLPPAGPRAANGPAGGAGRPCRRHGRRGRPRGGTARRGHSTAGQVPGTGGALLLRGPHA